MHGVPMRMQSIFFWRNMRFVSCNYLWPLCLFSLNNSEENRWYAGKFFLWLSSEFAKHLATQTIDCPLCVWWWFCSGWKTSTTSSIRAGCSYHFISSTTTIHFHMSGPLNSRLLYYLVENIIAMVQKETRKCYYFQDTPNRDVEAVGLRPNLMCNGQIWKLRVAIADS